MSCITNIHNLKAYHTIAQLNVFGHLLYRCIDIYTLHVFNNMINNMINDIF
jgi:hypothetical protein